MTDEKRSSYIRSYFKISVVTAVLFLVCFGVILVNSYRTTGASAGDGGFGMAGIFLFPVALAVLVLLVSAYLLFWNKRKSSDQLVFWILSALIIPVSLFGFILAVAIVRMLLGLIPHF